MKTKSALSYFGSDSEVAPALADLLNDRAHISIPFVGGASILPHLTARAIVCNDLNRDAIRFYRMLSGEYGESLRVQLLNRCRRTLSHPSELERAIHCIESGSLLGKAWGYWAMCWLGRKGKGGTDHLVNNSISVRWTAVGGTNASRLKAVKEDLEIWVEHFRRCEWTEMPFAAFLKKVKDDPKCGLYCDPPWVDAGDAYQHKFTANNHIALELHLRRFKKTKVLIRYGDHPSIRELYRKKWHIREAVSRDQRNKVKGEIWITNNF